MEREALEREVISKVQGHASLMMEDVRNMSLSELQAFDKDMDNILIMWKSGNLEIENQET